MVKCLEIPAASQGETKEKALRNIIKAIKGYIEGKGELLMGKVKGEKFVVVEAPSTFMA